MYKQNPKRQYEVLQPVKQQMKIKPYPGSQMGLDLGCILHITANARVSKIGTFCCYSKRFCVENLNIFCIFAQNINCVYMLELPHLGASNKYPKSMF